MISIVVWQGLGVDSPTTVAGSEVAGIGSRWDWFPWDWFPWDWFPEPDEPKSDEDESSEGNEIETANGQQMNREPIGATD